MKQVILLFVLSFALFSCSGDGSVQTKSTSTDEFDYQAIIDKSDKPVVVDFWASWCGPCKIISPYIEELAEEYKGEVVVLKINIDKNPSIANKYNINSIPHVMYLKNGEIIESQIGGYPRFEYKKRFSKLAGH